MDIGRIQHEIFGSKKQDEPKQSKLESYEKSKQTIESLCGFLNLRAEYNQRQIKYVTSSSPPLNITSDDHKEAIIVKTTDEYLFNEFDIRAFGGAAIPEQKLMMLDIATGGQFLYSDYFNREETFKIGYIIYSDKESNVYAISLHRIKAIKALAESGIIDHLGQPFRIYTNAFNKDEDGKTSAIFVPTRYWACFGNHKTNEFKMTNLYDNDQIELMIQNIRPNRELDLT